jgi:hypothetical protein
MRYALILLALLAASVAPNVSAHIPRPEPDPARLAAARRLVAALPIAETVRPRPDGGEPMRAGLAYRMAYEAQQTHGVRDLERIMPAFQAEIYARVEAVLPAILPAALDDLARIYAFEMQAADLDAAARFFATPEGRAFAARTVVTDRIVFEALHGRLAGAILPELGTVLATARTRDAEQRRAYAEWDRLRQRVNAGSRRRSRR